MRGYMAKKGETNPVCVCLYVCVCVSVCVNITVCVCICLCLYVYVCVCMSISTHATQTYKRRFFILKGKFLYYFKSEDDMDDVQAIDLRLADEIEEVAKQEKVG